VGQLFLLAEFIGDGYVLYGVHALTDVIRRKYHNSRLFPRITLCDLDIRQFSNVQQYTVQCALPINLFNEKMYLFLWFWLSLLSVLNIWSMAECMWNAFLFNRQAFILHYLRIAANNHLLSEPVSNRHFLYRFVSHYLRQDGSLVLRALESNTSDVLLTEIIASLWNCFMSGAGEERERMICMEDVTAYSEPEQLSVYPYKKINAKFTRKKAQSV